MGSVGEENETKGGKPSFPYVQSWLFTLIVRTSPKTRLSAGRRHSGGKCKTRDMGCSLIHLHVQDIHGSSSGSLYKEPESNLGAELIHSHYLHNTWGQSAEKQIGTFQILLSVQ